MIIDNYTKIKGYLEFTDWVKKVYKDSKILYCFEEFNNLPELYMDIICLHFVYYMTFKEIGEIYGFSKSNAQAKLYHAHRKLNRGDFDTDKTCRAGA